VNQAGTTTFSGYVDAYYAFDFNQPKSKVIPYLYNYNRHNEFNVNLAVLSAKYSSEKVRGVISLQTGTYPEYNYSAEAPIAQHIYEAYAGFRPFKKFWLDAGIFSSHIGFESALANVNWTLSRSMSAENTPYFETGARLTYEASDKWTLYALVLNGWQNIHQLNQGKALGTEVQFKPRKNMLLNWSTYLGDAGNDTSYGHRRIFNDFYITTTLSAKWKLAALFDFGFQKHSDTSSWNNWYNAGLVLRYELTDHTAFAGRVEYYNDPDGIIIPTGTHNGFQTFGASVNYDYKPTKNFMFRLEAKHYFSKDNIYQQDNKTVANETVLTGSMIASF
jgi:hypothetical protein